MIDEIHLANSVLLHGGLFDGTLFPLYSDAIPTTIVFRMAKQSEEDGKLQFTEISEEYVLGGGGPVVKVITRDGEEVFENWDGGLGDPCDVPEHHLQSLLPCPLETIRTWYPTVHEVEQLPGAAEIHLRCDYYLRDDRRVDIVCRELCKK